MDYMEIRDGTGQQALDILQQLKRLEGTAVINGLSVSAGSGMDVSVSQGSALINGQIVEYPGGSVTLSDGDPNKPRKDLVMIDSSGTVFVEEGVPEDPKPGSESDTFDLQRPAPSDLEGVSGTVLSEVFVGSGATAIQGADYVRDRRLSAEITASGVKIISDPSDDDEAVPKLYNDSKFTLHESNLFLGPYESVRLDRFQIPGGEEIKVVGASVSSSDIELEIFDETLDKTVYAVNGPLLEKGVDLYTGSGGNTIDIRLVNISDTDKVATCKISYIII